MSELPLLENETFWEYEQVKLMAIMTRLDRLMRYIREDRLNRFKVYIKKHKLDVKNLSLSKGRTLLHYAAKHGSGSFVKWVKYIKLCI